MRKSSGFTLIEMMIVIAIVAVIASYGIPQFNSMMQNGRLSTQVNELQGLMQLARSEAATNRVVTRICGSTDQATCNTNNWEGGAILFRDRDNNGSASTAELVRVMPAVTNGNTIRGVTGAISFLADGTLASAAMLRICDTRGAESSRQVRLNTAGQSRISKGNPGDVTCP
ncbi:GspH/FimT family protein [Aquipseudomonas campi]|uniref:Type II secretion system protein H n=1 Tax=Aquipseudomonas campi TaxID=2731681 RepID=A0A6M8FKS7_9GAMM|nr:GspH/FimT family pseudopilin [Pseudomonas campi]QKE64489.1 GspH/FimT family protein [Pseudomonas campi]